jgi:hypothetical protein
MAAGRLGDGAGNGVRLSLERVVRIVDHTRGAHDASGRVLQEQWQVGGG